MKRITINHFVMLVIAFVMANNIEHISYVHFSLAKQVFPDLWMNKLHSVVVVIIIEVSIMVFVIKGLQKWALLFTISIFVLSLDYYEIFTEIQSVRWYISSFVFSLIYTVSIYIFSEMFAELSKENKQSSDISTRIKKLLEKEKEVETSILEKEKIEVRVTDELASLSNDLEEGRVSLAKETERAELLLKEKAEIEQELTCEHCGDYKATNFRQLNAHKGKCFNNPKNKEKRG